MRTLNPSIRLQKIIGNQLYHAMQGDILSKVRNVCEGYSMDFFQRYHVASTTFHITPETMPKLNDLCMEVKKSLNFNDDVEFYLAGDSEVNARTYNSEDSSKPHIVIINSGLFKLMNDDEMKFIIGHELGHLINRDSTIIRLYHFLYPMEDDAPTLLESRMKQYNQLAEYSADRYGFLACQNLEACISSFYKMKSGIDLEKMNVSIEALIEENLKTVQKYFDESIVASHSHPDSPLRVHALMLFAVCKTQKSFDENMDVLFDLMPNMTFSETDSHFARFIAAAGLKLANLDGKMEKWERDRIIDTLAEKVLEPSKLLKTVQKEGIDQVMEESLTILLDQEIEKSEEIMSYLIRIAFADKVITDEEINFIVDFGQNKLGMTVQETYMAISEELQKEYDSLSNHM